MDGMSRLDLSLVFFIKLSVLWAQSEIGNIDKVLKKMKSYFRFK